MDMKFMQKKLLKHIEDCHKSAMDAIDIISENGLSQMQSEGVSVDINDVQPYQIGKYAAKKLGLAERVIVDEYIDMMLFEKMIVMENEKTSSH